MTDTEVEKYASYCSKEICRANLIYMRDKETMAIHAWNKLHPENKLFNPHQDFVDVVNWWKKQPQSTVEELHALLVAFDKDLTFTTNKIEGVDLQTSFIADIYCTGCVTNYTGSIKNLILIENHKQAFMKMLDCVIGNESITTTLIKHFHNLIMSGCYSDELVQKGERPGCYKKGDYVIGREEYGSLPHDVSGDMIDLVQQIDEVKGGLPHVIAALIHCNFELIHPFADGNGRVGRMLMNYYLLTKKCPPILIFPEDKELYYESIDWFSRELNLVPIVNFIERQTVKTWKQTMGGIS